MNDMDIDFDMDGEKDPEIARLEAEMEAINAVRFTADSLLGTGLMQTTARCSSGD